MRTLIPIIVLLVGWCMPVTAQWHWVGGGAIGSSPLSVLRSGQIGLNAVPDRFWIAGLYRTIRKQRVNFSAGIFTSIQLRSPFYELDRSIPYYPVKKPVPTFQLESVQFNPFVSIGAPFRLLKRFSWLLRTGGVFVLHGGNFLSTTTGLTRSDRTPFVLYRLAVHRQPLGIPFSRTQLGLSYQVLDRKKWTCFLQPMIQFDLGDRSEVTFRSVPDDPVFASSGHLRNRKWSAAIVCEVVKKR